MAVLPRRRRGDDPGQCLLERGSTTTVAGLTQAISVTGVTAGNGLIVCIADAFKGGTTVSGVRES
jgi:hypothetical protein